MMGSMSDAGRPARHTPKTARDLFAIPDEERHHELIAGEIVERAAPSAEHGTAQRKLGYLVEPFDRLPGGRWPGGWWLMSEVEVEFAANEVYRHDLVGWRRERVPERPRGTPIRLRPDWIAEILSPSNSGIDRVKKLNLYHRFQVPHYWIVDPLEETLSVFRWTEPGYLLVMAAATGDRVRAEPFDAVELEVSVIFGYEPSDDV
jgi:Uma2 family endonuclease